MHQPKRYVIWFKPPITQPHTHMYMQVVMHKGENTFIETLLDGETARELRLYILTQKDRALSHTIKTI